MNDLYNIPVKQRAPVQELLRRLVLWCAILLVWPGGIALAQPQPSRTVPVLQQRLRQPALPDTERLHLLTELAYLYVLRPGTEKNDMDSALQLAREAEMIGLQRQRPAWEARAWVILSNIYRELGDARADSNMHTTGYHYAEKAYQYFSRSSLPADAGYALAELVNYRHLDDFPQMRAVAGTLEKAAGLLAQGKDWQRVARLQERTAELYMLIGDYQLSLELAQHALDHYRTAGVREVQGVLNLMAVAYGELQDREQSIHYSALAVQTSEALRDSSALATEIYNYQGIHYFNEDDWEHAIAAFRKGWKLALLQKDTASVRFLLQNIGNCRLGQKRPAEALEAFRTVERRYPPQRAEDRVLLCAYTIRAQVQGHRTAESPPYARLMEQLVQHMSDMELQRSRAYYSLSMYYLAIHRYDQARHWNLADQSLQRNLHNRSALMMSYKTAYAIDSAWSDYVGAIRSYQQYSALKDSLFSDANAHQVTVLQTRFETAKKDQELRLRGQRIQLLNQQALLQTAALQKAYFVRKVIIVGALMLLLLLLLVYSRYQLKKRSNAAMQRKQHQIDGQHTSLRSLIQQQEKLLEEKEWLMKELHHRVKNNLQVVISLLNTQSVFLQNDDALMAIRESQQRMQAMSFIHQRLYQGDQLSRVDMNAYFRELIVHLEDTLELSGNPQFRVQGGEVMLEAAQAVPVGLILNETLTCASRDIVQGRQPVLITILLEATDGEACLRVHAANFNMDPVALAQRDRFGMELMKRMADQLGTQLAFTSEGGITLTLRFPVQHRMPRIATLPPQGYGIDVSE